MLISPAIGKSSSEVASLFHGCPVCGGHNKRLILDLVGVPLFCNVLAKTRDEALRAERCRLHLIYCPACGMIYNAAFDPQRVTCMWDYEKAQHSSLRFNRYLEGLATQLVTEYGIYEQDIVEIGCGDARFLKLLCKAGRNRGVGYDPAAPENLPSAAETDITIVRELYTDVARTTPPGFVCCRHVLEHLFDPIRFLNSIRRALEDRPDSHVYFEVPNVLSALRDLAVWEFLYEHGQYFSESSLSRLFTRCGFNVLEIRETFGGQFLSLVAMPAVGKAKQWKAGQIRHQLADQFVDQFASHYMLTVQYWRDTLQRLFDQGKKVAVWGAGTKGVMFLNSVPGGDRVQYVIDVNPRKRGCHVAGTGQRILSPAQLPNTALDVVIVMNPVYEEEIRAELRQSGVEAPVMFV